MGEGFYKLLAVLAAGTAVFLASYHYSKRLLDWFRFQSLGTRDYVVEKLAAMFIEVNPNQVLWGLALLGFVPAAFIFFLLYPQVLPGSVLAVVFLVVGFKCPKPIVDYMHRKRTDRFVLQMIDGLGLMSNALKSGLSLVQAIQLAAQELPNPMQQEFNLVLSENRLGVSLEDSLNNLVKRVPSEDVDMFVTAVNILKETGGNLAETFDTITTTIRERIKVGKRIDAMTAQGFMQGMIILCVPPVMGVIFYQTDPDSMTPLFTTPMGWGILGLIVLLELLGFFLIMKIVKIDV